MIQRTLYCLLFRERIVLSDIKTWWNEPWVNAVPTVTADTSGDVISVKVISLLLDKL